MDELFQKQLAENGLIYKRSLDRIIEKYSKIPNPDQGREVDLCTIKDKDFERYMRKTKVELDELESQRLKETRDESMSVQDISGDSQLDFMQQSSGADESCVSSFSNTLVSVQSDCEASGVSEAELQPEDLDQELEMTLRSNDSLAELYPSMISRIGRAVQRHTVSEAADNVLRRYRRWRQQPNRSFNSSNSFTSTRSKTSPQKRSSKEDSQSPVKRADQQDWHQQSPVRGRPIIVMDLSSPSRILKPKKIPVNQTFDMCLDESQHGEQPSVYSVSPSRSSYQSPKAPSDMSLRARRLFNAAQSQQIDGYSAYASQTTKERPDLYGSPVRQSPTKYLLMRSLSQSPRSSSRSPKLHPAESCSREPTRSRSESVCLSSPQRRTPQPLRTMCPQDWSPSFRLQQLAPRSASAAEPRHRRRHLSFDSSQASRPEFYSPKKLDEDFIKLYHKFVCQNKSSYFTGLPCRFCARSSEASRGHTSSSLAALALSPHRSVLRKRHRELSPESRLRSKRYRESCPSGLSASGAERQYDGCSLSPGKHIMFQRFSSQQRAAEHHQDAWMSRSQHRPAAESSRPGSSYERSAAGGSPRKWW
ncbi:uncharacterized protein LOC117827913 [Notolabrus celidotus]|uniref:uncharacterized protein LOC117827913 n=1 Tax=Notolabrus celidotus TaxID=1203425 RepID=UPI00148FD1CB|nr:uncharacterized protein LOC117827913 [Notolabrus celidotus]